MTRKETRLRETILQRRIRHKGALEASRRTLMEEFEKELDEAFGKKDEA